jgi:undecaprenyl diphosphate synthase
MPPQPSMVADEILRTESDPAGQPTDPCAPLPRHVAIIMDGNGRWARERGLSRHAGHRAGTENIRRIVETFAERGIEFLTLNAFSTENWKRSKREVDGLIRILGSVLDRELAHLHKNGIRLLHIGRLDRLPPRLQQKVEKAVEITRANTRMTVAIAFNYGGRADIVNAVQRLLADQIPADAIDERLLSSYLYTNGLPDPDLIIRTGGDLRLSNFMLWQAAYAELYFTDTFWPDFGRDQIEQALREFARRERRYGGIPEDYGHAGAAAVHLP